jgi:anti-sigma factor RsiW
MRTQRGKPEHDHARCRQLAEKLSEYLDSELTLEQCHEIETHFADCEPCQRFLDSLRNTVDWIRAEERPEMPPRMRVRVKAWLAEQSSEAGPG